MANQKPDGRLIRTEDGRRISAKARDNLPSNHDGVARRVWHTGNEEIDAFDNIPDPDVRQLLNDMHMPFSAREVAALVEDGHTARTLRPILERNSKTIHAGYLKAGLSTDLKPSGWIDPRSGKRGIKRARRRAR